MAQSVTLSSAGTATMVLNTQAKSTTVQLSVTSASSGNSQIEVSLDDPSIPGGPSTTWSLLSSATAIDSSNIFTTALLYTVLSPIAQVRIKSSTMGVGPVILKALQSITA